MTEFDPAMTPAGTPESVPPVLQPPIPEPAPAPQPAPQPAPLLSPQPAPAPKPATASKNKRLTAVKLGGFWQPFRLFPKKNVISGVRADFITTTDLVDTLTGEIEKARASIAWLDQERVEQMARLNSLRLRQAKAAKDTINYLEQIKS